VLNLEYSVVIVVPVSHTTTVYDVIVEPPWYGAIQVKRASLLPGIATSSAILHSEVRLIVEQMLEQLPLKVKAPKLQRQ